MYLLQGTRRVDGLFQLYVETDAIDVYLGNVAFYFFDFYVVIDALYFILILVHFLCYLKVEV